MISASHSPSPIVYTALHTAVDTGQPLSLGWIDLLPHRDYLVRFAKRKLRDGTQAEDMVHDVFEAVISGRASFAGRSALRSWLTAILKNKIIDEVRHNVRFDSYEGFDGDADDSETAQTVCPHARPDELAEHRQRLLQTMQRISSLPQTLRDVMQFRVLEEESSEDVCQRLCISESSLFVRLHRARKQLLC